MIGALERVLQKGKEVMNEGITRISTISEDEIDLNSFDADRPQETWQQFSEALSPNWVFRRNYIYIYFWSVSQDNGDARKEPTSNFQGPMLNCDKNEFSTLSRDIMSIQPVPRWDSLLNLKNTERYIELDLYRAYQQNVKREQNETMSNDSLPSMDELTRTIRNNCIIMNNLNLDIENVVLLARQFVEDKRNNIINLPISYFDATIGVWPFHVNLINIFKNIVNHKFTKRPNKKIESRLQYIYIYMANIDRSNTQFQINFNGCDYKGTWYHLLTNILVPSITKIILNAEEGSELASNYLNIRQYMNSCTTFKYLDEDPNAKPFEGIVIPPEVALVEWNSIYIYSNYILKWAISDFKSLSINFGTTVLSNLERSGSHHIPDELPPFAPHDVYTNIQVDPQGNISLEWESISACNKDSFTIYYRLLYPSYLNSVPHKINVAVSTINNFVDTSKTLNIKNGRYTTEIYKFLASKLVGSHPNILNLEKYKQCGMTWLNHTLLNHSTSCSSTTSSSNINSPRSILPNTTYSAVLCVTRS